jgi:cell division protein FtsI (penicillin-binding protein 3)
MADNEKKIVYRLYLIAALLLVVAIGVVVKMVQIQFIHGAEYKKLAEARTERMFVIEPNKGSLYSDDGSLLATSVSKFEIRWDAVTVSQKNFDTYLKPLSDSLAIMFDKPASHYSQLLRKAKHLKNRYALIAQDLDYYEYLRIKSFPLFKMGPYKGGFVVTQKTVREHPLGKIAERSIGYVKKDADGHFIRVGLEGAFSDYLDGKAGKRFKQKIANGQWKPLGLSNIVEPEDGYDVVSTIDINIQDIAHHALLAQLEKYQADHGCVVVMETKTGEIKAISNLGITDQGKYYERLNYAIGESHEPGSTFKLMSLVAALEDKVVDTTSVIDTKDGNYRVYNKTVHDSRRGGYGEISVAKAMELSSNTAFARMIHENYKDEPSRFVNRLRNMDVGIPLGMPIRGEGLPVLRSPGDKGWSGISLAWMSHGYEVSMTPLQTLTFYNAIANDGEMVKPRLIKEVRSWNKVIKKFDKEVMNPSICSEETLGEVRDLLKNIVEHKGATGHKLYDPNFSMAGKTGTAQKNYAGSDPDKLKYISSFAGYFPAEDPKYSCIVVIHEPDKKIGYYGADVSGPVFKSIAQKIYANAITVDEVNLDWKPQPSTASEQKRVQDLQSQDLNRMPNLKGLSGMEAISLLENAGLKVELKGNGVVRRQSVRAGTIIKKGQKVSIELL